MRNQYVLHINESVDINDWQELLANSPFSTPFQSPAFYNFCNKTENHQGLVCAVKPIGGLYGALCVANIVKEKGIKSYFSRRAIIYGGPILRDGNQQELLRLLLENMQNQLIDKVIYTEIRNLNDYSSYAEAIQQAGWKYIRWMNVRNDLNFQEQSDLLASFRYSRRREIQFCLKAGLIYHETSELGDVSEVYKILENLYKNRIYLPIPSFSFFRDYMASGLMKLFVVKDQDHVVGGSFCVVHENKALYTLYYCGKRDYKHNTFPTHMAVLAAMEYGRTNGFRHLDFMGAGKPERKYGVRDYKLGFGGELVETGRFLKIENKFLYYLGVQAIHFIQGNKKFLLHRDGLWNKKGSN